MSYDRKIDWACPHHVVNEGLYLKSDRQTVNPLRSIASAQSVAVRLNGEIECPSTGIQAPAVALAGAGNVTITAGVNDALTFQTESATVQATLKPGVGLSTTSIAQDLALKAGGLIVDVSDKGRLRVKTPRSGPGFWFRVLPSPAATTLGFAARTWTGRSVVPGWALIRNPRTIDSQPSRWIVFDSPLKGFKDFVEIGYVTTVEDCRRCGGTGVEHDWRYGATGEVVQVRDEALLVQDIQKLTWTRQGSNPTAPWYGTLLDNMVGGKMGRPGILEQLIQNDLREAFRRWQSIKKDQEERAGQPVSDREFPFRIYEIQAYRINETTMWVTGKVQSRALGEPLDISRGITVPGDISVSLTDGTIRNSINQFVRVG